MSRNTQTRSRDLPTGGAKPPSVLHPGKRRGMSQQLRVTRRVRVVDRLLSRHPIMPRCGTSLGHERCGGPRLRRQLAITYSVPGAESG